MENGKKVYTLKESKKTKDAHYKFIKVRDAPSNSKKKSSEKSLS